MTLNRYLSFFAFLYVGSVLVGIINNYSPVPFWDMWDAYLNFYMKVQRGDWYAWFAQHNEHRLVVPKLLFWLDIHCFNGTVYFLFVINFLLMVAMAYAFYKFISKIFRTPSSIRVPLALVVTILLSSWIQNENFTWAFQSQFFLAYLLPLLSFYFMARHVESNSSNYFALSIIFGTLSMLTMANGILTLPLLVVLGFGFRLPRYKQASLVVLTIISLYIYFLDYKTPAGHSSLRDAVMYRPKDFLLYAFTYLGGLFGKILGDDQLTITQLRCTQLVGMAFICSSVYATIWALKNKSDVFIFALLIFIAYIVATAFGTASGRFIFGPNQALSSRYLTPQLLGWAALLIIFVHFNRHTIGQSKCTGVAFFLIPLVLFYQQARAFEYHSASEHKLAALALELSVHDEIVTSKIYPNYSWLVSIAREAKAQNLSIFGQDEIRDISSMIGSKIEKLPTTDITGSLDLVESINGEQTYVRISGWIYDQREKTIPKSGFVVNGDNEIIGYVLTGFERRDVAHFIDRKAKYSGYRGYVIKQCAGEDCFIVSGIENKKLKINLNKSRIDVSCISNGKNEELVGVVSLYKLS